jgi:AcrR family transcriptional regulator
MANGKTQSSVAPVRGEKLRQQVVDGAERLIREGRPDFSMRDLAAEAGVSFATPFNQFGSKHGIMLALSARRIDAMEARFLGRGPAGNAVTRVFLAVETAALVMLEEPDVNRVVMGYLGAASPTPGRVWARSKALWALALAEGEGLDPERREQALACLPGHLAFAFRGVLSFWTAGELENEALVAKARELAKSLLIGFVEPEKR